MMHYIAHCHSLLHIYMYTCHKVLEKGPPRTRERKKLMAEKGTQELRLLFVVMLVSQRAAAAAAAYPPTPRRENDDCTKSPQSVLATIHIAHQHSVYPTIVVVT